jgi:hypothetical protein
MMKQLTESDLRRLAGLPEAQVKDKTDFDLDWDTMFDEPVNHKVSTTTAKKDKSVPDLKRASAAKTATATAHITPTDAMRDTLAKLDRSKFPAGTDDAEHIPEPPTTPQNLPSVISREIATTGGTVTPEWHTVSNLPGNVDRAIRMLGKRLFGAFTRTPTKDIIMIGNLGGSGPNTEEEVRSVANWVVKNGRLVDDAEIDFSDVMPGYKAQTRHYSTGSVRFQLVKDDHGTYIYAWPESDSLDRQEKIQNER